MAFVFKANLLARGRQLILQTSGIRKEFISLRIEKQAYEPLTQARSYSVESKDLPSENRERLYDGILHKKIRFIKMFSLATSVASLAFQPFIIMKAIETGNKVGAGGVMFIFGFFAFGTPILLHMITKRYVAHLDYDPVKDTYIATTYSLLAQRKEVEFTPEDVELPPMSEMLTTCFIKGRPMFLDARSFTDIDHYKRIMGFDKPMDFSLNDDDAESKKN